jgi:drug/metabolite transporter (DMT)-like permease
MVHRHHDGGVAIYSGNDRHRALVCPATLEWIQGVGIGLFAAGGMLFQNDGLQYTRASTSAFLTQFYAVLIPLWIALRSRRNPPRIVWVALTLVLVGGAVLAGFDPRHMHLGRGEAETLLSSLFFMGQVLMLSHEEYRGNRPIAITAVMFLTESAVFLLMIAVMQPSGAALRTPFQSMAWLAFMGIITVFCTLAAFLLMNGFQPRITPTEAGLIYCIEPIFSSILALFLPAWFSGWANIQYANESLTSSLLVGGALITIANVYLQVKQSSSGISY